MFLFIELFANVKRFVFLHLSGRMSYLKKTKKGG